MEQAGSVDVSMSRTPPAPPPEGPIPTTPLSWRFGLAATVVALTVAATLGREVLGPRGQAALGVVAFILTAGVFSANLRAINWRTVGWGFALQVLLALFVIKFEVHLEFAGVNYSGRPGYEMFNAAGGVVKKFLQFSDEGASFVFGSLAGPKAPFIFAFRALPTIIFVSSFFTILYYYGVLQFVVRVTARVMARLMRTSGAETLSVTANVFMGQTEAPLIVKPYIAAHDALGTAGADGRRHGPHFRQSDGGLHRHGRRRRRYPDHERDGVALHSLPCQDHAAREGKATDDW